MTKKVCLLNDLIYVWSPLLAGVVWLRRHLLQVGLFAIVFAVSGHFLLFGCCFSCRNSS